MNSGIIKERRFPLMKSMVNLLSLVPVATLPRTLGKKWLSCFIFRTLAVSLERHWFVLLATGFSSFNFALLIVTLEEMPAKTKCNQNFVDTRDFNTCLASPTFLHNCGKIVKFSIHFWQSLTFEDDEFCWTDLTNNMYVPPHLKVNLNMNLRWCKPIYL